ncbi:MAG: cupin domain-containing protein [Pseudonocardiaceae bacterium]
MRKAGKIAAVAVYATALGLLPAAAQATPGSGVTGTVLAQGTTNSGFRLETHGSSEFVVRHITIQPGGSTGWHYHPGTLLAVVQQGALTRIDADCQSAVYVAGQSLVEPSGSRHVHIGRNLGTEPAELYVTYVNPIGSPLSVDAPDPGCGKHRE